MGSVSAGRRGVRCCGSSEPACRRIAEPWPTREPFGSRSSHVSMPDTSARECKLAGIRLGVLGTMACPISRYPALLVHDYLKLASAQVRSETRMRSLAGSQTPCSQALATPQDLVAPRAQEPVFQLIPYSVHRVVTESPLFSVAAANFRRTQPVGCVRNSLYELSAISPRCRSSSAPAIARSNRRSCASRSCPGPDGHRVLPGRPCQFH